MIEKLTALLFTLVLAIGLSAPAAEARGYSRHRGSGFGIGFRIGRGYRGHRRGGFGRYRSYYDKRYYGRYYYPRYNAYRAFPYRPYGGFGAYYPYCY